MKFTTSVSPRDKKGIPTMYFSASQIKELLAISPYALIQMQLYVGLAKMSNPSLEDEHIANILGISDRIVQRTRLELTKAGWFKRVKSTHKGETHVAYYVGKEAVQGKTTYVFD